jgi:hypothetical protein
MFNYYKLKITFNVKKIKIDRTFNQKTFHLIIIS